jgi:hypothetical protein
MAEGGYYYGTFVTASKPFTCSCLPADGKDLSPW